MFTSAWRPGVERRAYERGAPASRLARHLFDTATTATPGKEVRVTGIADRLVTDRRLAWETGNRPIAAARWASAGWHTLAWAIFGAAYVGAIVFVSSGLGAPAGDVLLTLAAGSRLSFYVGATVGEIGFLRGIWMDAARRLAWLEDYAGSLVAAADQPAPEPAGRRDPLRARLVRVSRDRSARARRHHLELPAGTVVAIVGENGAGKIDAGEAAREDVRADAAAASSIDRTRPRAHSRRRLARASCRRLPGLLPLRVPRASHRRHRRSAAPGRRARSRHGCQPGRRRRCGRAAGGRPGHAARTDVAGRRGDVSFGQWQKLALARGFMRDEPLVLVLDEPTAALDAETEHALFERYAAAVREEDDSNGRITILVSHRFSTVRMADLIVVLDGARVVEVGTHAALMAQRGQYAQLYGIQAAAYR